MATRRKRGPPPGRLHRSQGTRALPKPVWVFTEGKHEKHILDQLRRRWRRSEVKIRVFAERGDPRRVVQAARKELQNSRPRRDQTPEVWVVFDRDTHVQWEPAIQAADQAGFQVAISNPCVELWGILLFTDQHSSISSAKAQSKLRQLHPSYRHDRGNSFRLDGVSDEQVQKADDRAEQLLNVARRSSSLYKNPSTTFHRLVRRLYAPH